MTAVIESNESVTPDGFSHASGEREMVTVGCPLVLPEPVPNRAESVAPGRVGQWLRNVATTDRHGFTLISGKGWTTAVVYLDGALLAASRIRGDDGLTGEGVLRALWNEREEAFAVAHRLRPEIARALSGVFSTPTWLGMTGADRTLEDLLERLRLTSFTGAVHIGFDPELWAIVLCDGGVPLVSYGADDRMLKPDLPELVVLRGFASLSVAIHPPLQDVLPVEFDSPKTSVIPPTDNRDLIAVESMLIEALSTLDHGLVTAVDGDNDQSERIALALVATYGHLTNAQVIIGAASLEDAPAHPLIVPYWSETQRQINTTRLLNALHLATIPDAWSVAIHALVEAIDRRIGQQTTWLGRADATSASVLAETARDLLLRARSLAGGPGSIGR